MKPIATIGMLLLYPFAVFPQEPAAQQPETPAQQQPAPAAPKPTPPKPAPAKNQAGRSTFEENESIWSLSIFYWKPQDADGRLAGGEKSTDPPAQTINLFGMPKQVPGAMLTIPTGRSNRVEISVWEARTSGNTTATRDYSFFGETFHTNDFLTTQNRIRNAKVTWNYLSFPYPPLDSKFRLKTLWEFQYVGTRPVITAPYTAVPATSDTAAVPAVQTIGKRNVFLPTLGLGVELIPSAKHFRIEAKGSAMAFPGRSQIWDTEGSAVLRIASLEVFAGAKYFHYRTSPKNDQYVEGNIWGPLAGVRWVFR